MKTTFAKPAAAATLAALFAFGGGVSAQQQGTGGDPAAGYGAQPSAPVNVDDATLSEFADAYLSVQEIRQDLSDQLAEAPDRAAAQTMQRQAQDEMAQAVKDSGVSVQEYNDIAVGLQNDPELAQRVKEAIDQVR